jgi:hypothetical protein
VRNLWKINKTAKLGIIEDIVSDVSQDAGFKNRKNL